MKIISREEVHAALKYPDLIDALGEAFTKKFTMQPRKVFLLDESDTNHDALSRCPALKDTTIVRRAFA